MLLEFSATISTGNQLNRGDYALEIDLNDLLRRRTGGAEDEVLCEGEWSFSIPLAAESLSPTITNDRVQVLSTLMVWDQATGKEGGASCFSGCLNSIKRLSISSKKQFNSSGLNCPHSPFRIISTAFLCEYAFL